MVVKAGKEVTTHTEAGVMVDTAGKEVKAGKEATAHKETAAGVMVGTGTADRNTLEVHPEECQDATDQIFWKFNQSNKEVA